MSKDENVQRLTETIIERDRIIKEQKEIIKDLEYNLFQDTGR